MRFSIKMLASPYKIVKYDEKNVVLFGVSTDNRQSSQVSFYAIKCNEIQNCIVTFLYGTFYVKAYSLYHYKCG